MDGDRWQPCQGNVHPVDVVGGHAWQATTTMRSSSPVATASMPSAAPAALDGIESIRSPNGLMKRLRRPTTS